jgi:hypothetical protein
MSGLSSPSDEAEAGVHYGYFLTFLFEPRVMFSLSEVVCKVSGSAAICLV